MLQEQPFDIRRLHESYAAGEKPAKVVEEVYRRIEEAADPGIFLYLIEKKAALEAVGELGPFDPVNKPLWGIPFAIKDNIDVAGLPTTAACPDYAYNADKDAFVIDRLRRAGAILIGKTNLDQFATGLVGVRTPYPVPINALDPEMVPGGSSSGSAVAVALGLVSFALGTDTAGSGRVPAALNGIVGLKPTLGALSSSGVVPACRTLDTVSIFSLLVEDASTVLTVTAAYDEADSYARPLTTPPLSPPPPSYKVGVPDQASRRFFGDDAQESSFEKTLNHMSELGAEIVEIDFSLLYEVADMLYEGAWVAERYSVVEDFKKQHPGSLHPITRQVIDVAETMSAADAFQGFYRLQELKRQTMPLIDTVDLLCVPTIPTFYSLADLEADPVGANARLGTYTNFVNLLDLCGLAVPVENREDGRPGSVTLLGPSASDGRIAAVARSLQYKCRGPLGATAWSLPEEGKLQPAPAADEIALAAVGAHMSGLPLNHELARLGARFLYAAKTAPEYKLYSLPGGPPYRPGLIRDEDGSSIAIEVWALPAARFGDFIKGIPQPLGIGTLNLENNEQVKGFICEACGRDGAEDVTIHGGWRNYLHSLSTPQLQSKEIQHA